MPPIDFIVTNEWKISQIYKLVHAAFYMNFILQLESFLNLLQPIYFENKS